MFAVADEDAEPIAVYPESGAVAAARKGNNWYFGVPLFDPECARQVMVAGNAHVYCEAGDPIIAGNGLVVLNSCFGGSRCVNFRNGRQTACELPPFTTAVFDAETGERIL